MIPSFPSALSIFCGFFTTPDYIGSAHLVIWSFHDVVIGVGLFRKSSQEPLAVTMAGVKLGQRLLAVGGRDPKLVARLATRTGLTGRACLVEADDASLAKASAAIEQEGALVEATRAPYGMWPFDENSFDVAVIPDLLPSLTRDVRVRCIADVHRVLRPGGRVLVIERAARGGIAGILTGSRTASPEAGRYTGPADALRDNGFAAVRQLAETDGVSYVEGIKKA
jgi:ubiquinone/menaquinone biosynthesis C-methylase UbiE